MTDQLESGTEWPPTIGRALGFLVLQASDMRDKSVLEQAEFLQRFGFSRRDQASIIGSSEASIAELARRSRLARGASRSGTKKPSTKKATRARKR